jgi:hypothetical protein
MERLEDLRHPDSRLNRKLVLKCFDLIPSESGDLSSESELALGLGDRPLNQEQRSTVSRVLGSEVCFAWGPPATGKTFTAGETIAALHRREESVLAMAHTNVATDTLTLAVAKAMENTAALDNGEILRLGTPRLAKVRELKSVSPLAIVEKQNPNLFAELRRLERAAADSASADRRAVRHLGQIIKAGPEMQLMKSRIAEIRDKIRRLLDDLVARARVILTTFAYASVYESIYSRRFDASLVDEASMAMPPQVAFAASLATKRNAVFGDFRQLPPIVRANTRAAIECLSQDVFSISGVEARVNAKVPDPRLVTLRVQYRMAPRICAVVNGPVYGGILVDGANVQADTARLIEQLPMPGAAVVVYDLGASQPTAYTDRQSRSHFNPGTALLTFGLAREATVRGATGLTILTPYSRQANIFRLLAEDAGMNEQLLVSTVHRLQGGETDYVFVDLTDARPLTQPGILLRGGFGSPGMRLLNVAFSRARGKLVILCDLQYFRRTLPNDAMLQTFFDHMVALQVPFAPFPFELLQTGAAPKAGVSFFPDPPQAWSAIYADMAQTQNRIIINWPGQDVDQVLTDDLVSWMIQSGARIAVAARPGLAVKARLENRGVLVEPTKAEEYVIQIGDDIFWCLGVNAGDNVQRPFIRVQGQKAPNLLAELLGLNTIIAPARRIHKGTRPGRTTARSHPVELLTDR